MDRGVDAARPATCLYYPLGRASIKMKDAEAEDDFHFLVEEAHCKGHEEQKPQPIEWFRDVRGVAWHDRVDRGWYDIMMKMVSWRSLGGPHGRDLAPRTRKMFRMTSPHVDAFRRFVLETRFLETYLIDDEALLALGFGWMKNVRFNEPTMSMREDVLRDAVARARSEAGAG